ncbi:DUF4124 domain-containing protein [Halothiobacillus sp.]|uniref:DUF4124 domain-containing protein n=1 Tax=Halothiobacillus sp. TaxID=1891311 RepID=UPI00260D296B|nr:DUF4124 domain-containing protein [Halothiobacillus sp.]
MIALTAAATFMFSAASQADGSTQIYKWVDKNGETHFSQLPPKHGEAQIINPDYANPDSNEDSMAAPAEKNKDETKKPLAPDQPVLAINKKEAAKACEAAKAQIKMLQNTQNQLMTQDADGKYRPLTSEEIAGRLKQAQDVANKACVQ